MALEYSRAGSVFRASTGLGIGTDKWCCNAAVYRDLELFKISTTSMG